MTSRYSISQSGQSWQFEVTDTEDPCTDAFGNKSTTKEVVARYDSREEAARYVELTLMLDALDNAGFATRRYSAQGNALFEVVKFLHHHICRFDNNNLRRVSEMSVLDLVNCYADTFPGVRKLSPAVKPKE